MPGNRFFLLCAIGGFLPCCLHQPEDVLAVAVQLGRPDAGNRDEARWIGRTLPILIERAGPHSVWGRMADTCKSR